MDPSLISFGMNAVVGLVNGSSSRSITRSQNKVAAANTAAANLMRTANNQLSAARGSLARYNQSDKNSRVLDGMGGVMEANAVNFQRARDGATEDSFEQQIAFAEQAGAQAAAGAASGLVGGVVDVVAGTTALRQERIAQRSKQAMKEADFDAGRERLNVFREGLDAMDHTSIIDDIDYSTNLFMPANTGTNFLTDIFGGQSKEDLRGASNALGGFFKKEAVKYINDDRDMN
jgi:hypothetical protein